MRIYVRWCGFDWCMFVGTWLFSDLVVTKYVKDATPIIPPEPIVEIKSVNGKALRHILNKLSDLISLATAIAWTKRLGFRVFITDLVIKEPMEDYLKAALAGNVDGLLNIYGEINIEQDLVNAVNTKPSKGSPGYLVIDALRGLSTNAEGVYGVILMNTPLDINWIIRFRSLIESYYGNVELFTSIGIDGLVGGFVRNLVGLVNGLVLTEIPSLVSLWFDDAPATNVFRCSNCYVDYITNKELRKCPRCGGKLRPVLKSWGKLETMDIKVIRLKARDEISLMRTKAPEISSL